MPSKKDAVIKIGLVCSVCGRVNYITSKNKLENKDKLILKKYCRYDRKHTEHKETDRLK